MVDLAVQAFKTNNFDLAAEIYERTIAENGPTSDLYIGLADSFARSGQFRKAFEAYSNGFRLGSPSLERLKHLVTALIDTVKQDSVVSDVVMNKKCIFTCVLCRSLLNDPITIPCGHTFCRKCFEKEKTKNCRKCGTSHFYMKASNIKTNVLMSKVISTWFPSECKSVKLKTEGNYYFERRKFDKSIDLYGQALILAPNDHLVLSNRSHAFISLERYKEALGDAENVIRLRPDWPKGYYRKGCALYGIELYEDCVVAQLQCLALDPSVTLAKTCLSKALHKILSPLPPDDPKAAEIQSNLSPSMLQRLILANFSSSLLLPHITMEKISQLKTIISETMVTATSFAVTNEEMKPDFDKNEEYAENCDCEEENQKPSKMVVDDPSPSRSKSVPDLSSKENPLRSERARSQSPDSSCSRKRTRIPSETSPKTPTKESPFKIQKNENQVPVDAVEINADLLKSEDFECSLCYRLLYEPVTTPCGHAFCRPCLDRSLDHQTNCPLCKSSLVEYLAERRQSVTECIEGIVETYFTAEFTERKKAHEEEMEELARMVNDQHEIPIFVCTMAYPSIACPLHIFEPKYRLLIRQCMESGTRQFGMCINVSEDTYADFGCMLEIRDVQYFSDGRSLVDTVGGRRFKVISRSHKDGYNTAKVEFITDQTVEGEEAVELQKLQTEVYTMCKKWLDDLPGMQREQILRHLGQFPALEENFQNYPNGCAWLWWILSVLPMVDSRIQLAVLAMTSYKERLEGIKRIVQYIQQRHGR